ncbi:hypothetical protein [Phytohabitans kaempferiae]|uniref:Uncharacterized protein n=1 Tax=Phytohabitans kaempferiae TaxID=1620943 RepID=A0ABV6MEU3_9ACTN
MGDLDARHNRRRRIALVVVAAVVATGCVGLSCAGLWVYASHDPPELIDSEVADIADRACATMQAAVAARAAPPNAPIDAKVRSIGDQNAAVRTMVAQVRGLGDERLEDDLPSAAWLVDWETLVEVREQYAQDLSAGREPRFAVPMVDGVPITDRMNDVGLDCQVPPLLLDLR